MLKFGFTCLLLISITMGLSSCKIRAKALNDYKESGTEIREGRGAFTGKKGGIVIKR